jgi:predicted dehydrogenase
VISVGVVGLGYWGPNLVRNLNACGDTHLAWICDLKPERLQALGDQYPAAARTAHFEDVLEDPKVDAVVVASPVGTHYPLAKAALERGKHVLVEKPLAASVDEAEALAELAAARGLVLLVDHVFLYSPSVRKMADLIRSGEIGEILFIDSVRVNLGIFQHDVNVVWDLAPHDLSIIDHLVGRKPRSIIAVGSAHAADGREDVAYLHLDYGDNLLASVHVNWLSPVKIRHFLIGGRRRSVLYNELDISERVKVYDRGIDVSEDPEGIRRRLISYRSGDVLAPRLDLREPIAYLIEHFVDCIENKAEPISGTEQGVRVVRILDAATRSLAGGGTRIDL